jgi:hypothetical protein
MLGSNWISGCSGMLVFAVVPNLGFEIALAFLCGCGEDSVKREVKQGPHIDNALNFVGLTFHEPLCTYTVPFQLFQKLQLHVLKLVQMSRELIKAFHHALGGLRSASRTSVARNSLKKASS